MNCARRKIFAIDVSQMQTKMQSPISPRNVAIFDWFSNCPVRNNFSKRRRFDVENKSRKSESFRNFY